MSAPTKTKFFDPGEATFISPEIQFREAFLKAQQDFELADKSKTNPHFKSHYSTLKDVWGAAKDSLHKNGLMVHQLFTSHDGQTALITKLCHVAGHWETSSCLLPVNTDPQKMGSAITYFRRYSLAAILGIVQDDDDGNASSEQSLERSRPTAAATSYNNEYRMGIPKNRNLGKTLDEMGRAAVISDFEYWSGRIKKEGKPATGEVKKFLDHAGTWLSADNSMNPPPIDDMDLPF